MSHVRTRKMSKLGEVNRRLNKKNEHQMTYMSNMLVRGGYKADESKIQSPELIESSIFFREKVNDNEK